MKKIKSTLSKIGSSKVLTFIILLVIHIFICLAIYKFLYDQITLILGGFTLLTVLLVIWIINSDTNSSYKLSWIILVLVLPGIGSIFYLYVRTDSLYKRIKNAYKKSKAVTSSYLNKNDLVMKSLKEDNSLIYGISNYCLNVSGYPTYDKTQVEYLKVGEEYYDSLLNSLKHAKKFILLEYFIINNDYMWQTILNVLINKVKEGVEVRVMYDGFGSLITLPKGYREYLERYGIKSAVFSEVSPFLAVHQNNRDHRKIAVIDGEIGYTGGINLADEYINRIVRFGHWKDTGVKLEGDAVNSLTMMFFELWSLASREKVDYTKYIKTFKKISASGYVLPFSDSPFDNVELAEDIYINILNMASEYVYITTPYLILDDHILKALDNAVRRGVDVRIIVPHIPDKQYVYYLASAQYKMLIKRGIKIYEYTPGFIHAKMFIADDKMGVVGTVNLDYRSLYLHFENGVFLYKNDALNDILKDVKETLAASIEVTEKYVKKIPIYKKVLGKILKIIAPLM